MKYKFILLGLLLWVIQSQAQTDDNILWSSLKIKKNFDKTTFALEPYFRFDNDISRYQNMSIDYYVKRKFGEDWSAQLLGRTWFVPNNPNRQFIWLDIAYGKKLNKIVGIGSRLRHHYAVDLKKRKDPDFIRWKTTVSFSILGKVKPFIAIEPWFRLNHFNQLQRIRYEPGVKFKIISNLEFAFTFRREESINLNPSRKVNMYVVTLAYSIPNK